MEGEHTTQQAELLVRLLVIERQLLEYEKSRDKTNSSIEDLTTKFDSMKDNIRQYKNIPDIITKLEKLESRLNTVDLEMVSMAPIKKIFSYGAMFFLASILSVFWNVAMNQTKNDYSEIAKKIISEYNKEENKNNNGK